MQSRARRRPGAILGGWDQNQGSRLRARSVPQHAIEFPAQVLGVANRELQERHALDAAFPLLGNLKHEAASDREQVKLAVGREHGRACRMRRVRRITEIGSLHS